MAPCWIAPRVAEAFIRKRTAMDWDFDQLAFEWLILGWPISSCGMNSAYPNVVVMEERFVVIFLS